MEFTVSSKALRGAIFAATVRTGQSPDVLARRVRVTPAVVADPDARVSHARVAAAWATLARDAGDPALGLFAAQLVDTAASDRLEPLLSHAPSLGAAVDTFVRYQKLYHTGAASYSERGKKAWRIGFALHEDAVASPELRDFVLANWMRRMRRAVGVDLPLIEARLNLARPSDPAPYVAVFGPNLRFDASDDLLLLAPEAADLPIAGANPTLRAIFEGHARADLDALDPDNAFLTDARASLEMSLRDGVASVESLARAMAMKPPHAPAPALVVRHLISTLARRRTPPARARAPCAGTERDRHGLHARVLGAQRVQPRLPALDRPRPAHGGPRRVGADAPRPVRRSDGVALVRFERTKTRR